MAVAAEVHWQRFLEDKQSKELFLHSFVVLLLFPL